MILWFYHIVDDTAVMALPSLHNNKGKVCILFLIWFFYLKFSVSMLFKFFITIPLFIGRFFGRYRPSDAYSCLYFKRVILLNLLFARNK